MKSNTRRRAPFPLGRQRLRTLPALATALALITALGSCSEPAARPAPTPPAPAPTIAPAAMVTPVAPPLAWQDAPVTPGDWQWQPGMARFVSQGQVLVSLECARASGIIKVLRHGAAPGGGTLELATTTLTRPLAAAPLADGTALVAQLAAGDPRLDAVAFSHGRFALEAGGMAPLVLPVWPEVARVVEDCR